MLMSKVACGVDSIKRIEASLELIHKMGGHVETRCDFPFFVERDWSAEQFMDLWAGKYARNIAEHYHEILRDPTIGVLRNALKKKAAVAVVGAGPSLDKNAHLLGDFPGVIIACDRAAKALTARGIRPDLVLCVDPRTAVMAEMLNYPENRFQRAVLSVCVDPEVARVWRGKRCYENPIHEGTQFFERICAELFPGMVGLQASGNVGNTGVQLADWIGAKRIVLVGQDYSYPGGRQHCHDHVRFPNGTWAMVKSTTAENRAVLANRSGKVWEGGIQTYPPFLSYRKTLGQLISDCKLDVVNATEGGILTNLPCAPLKDVIKKLRLQKYQASEGRALLDRAAGGTP